MKHFLSFLLIASAFSATAAPALDEANCKTLRACVDWVSGKTGTKYELGKMEKRSLKIDKDFSLKDGDPDLLFSYVLQSNDLVRIKRESGAYQIIVSRDMKDFQFPVVKAEEIPASLDYYTTEFSLSNKERVANARVMLKKVLSKNGRMLEVADSPKLQIIDTGFQLNGIKLMLNELNK